jgi:hypothetical protein
MYGGGDPAAVVVTAGADRVICFVPEINIDAMRSADYRIHGFDKSGKAIFDLAAPGDGSAARPRGLTVSPEGNLLAWATADNSIWVSRTDTGAEVWQWKAPPEVAGVGSFVLDDSGSVRAFGTTQASTSGLLEPCVWEINAAAKMSERLRIDVPTPESTVSLLLVGQDAPALWMRNGRFLGTLKLELNGDGGGER